VDGCTVELSPLSWAEALEFIERFSKCLTAEETTRLALEACAAAINGALSPGDMGTWNLRGFARTPSFCNGWQMK
jgi:hypothetical protein